MQLKRLLEFFQDGEGLLSSTRLAFLSTILLVLAVWGYTSFHTKTIQPLDNSIVYLVTALMAGKVGQSFAENKTPSQRAGIV
jgi:hypothetical protein